MTSKNKASTRRKIRFQKNRNLPNISRMPCEKRRAPWFRDECYFESDGLHGDNVIVEPQIGQFSLPMPLIDTGFESRAKRQCRSKHSNMNHDNLDTRNSKCHGTTYDIPMDNYTNDILHNAHELPGSLPEHYSPYNRQTGLCGKPGSLTEGDSRLHAPSVVTGKSINNQSAIGHSDTHYNSFGSNFRNADTSYYYANGHAPVTNLLHGDENHMETEGGQSYGAVLHQVYHPLPETRNLCSRCLAGEPGHFRHAVS